MAKKMILKGVGSFMAKRAAADGKGVEVVTLGTMTDLKIDLSVTLNDIFGGDGLFAIDQLVTQKAIEISATDAKFDLASLQLMMGSNVREAVVDQSLWVLNEQGVAVTGTIGTSIAVSKVETDFGGTLFGDGDFQVKLKDSNKLLKKVATSTTIAPGDDEFFTESVVGTPTVVNVILSPSNAGKDITFNYTRKDVVDIVDILSDEVPFPVHVIHHGSFMQKDGTFAGIETELYSCIANGTFTIDAARATASSSAVALRVLDPERTDGRLGTIKRFSSAKKV